VSFLLSLALALLGIGMAAAVVRAALGGDRPLAFGRTVAVTSVVVLVATGLANAGGTLEWLMERRDNWDHVPAEDAVDRASPGAGVDPAFVDFAKGELLRGDTFFVSRNAGDGTRLWLNYRLAPNLAEDRLEEADWLIYWQEPDPFKTHRVPLDQVVAHLKWGPDVGLIRIRRES
jgi:hypothetical protein